MESNLQDASPPPREFPLEFLQRITNNFSKDNIIGEGGFGVVYKGLLDNGEEIALKKLNHTGLDDKEFTNEFNNIIRAHHQNIVQFVGYCYHPGSWIMHNGQYIFAHEPIRILCFEYLHGGNLESLLSDEQPCRSDWQTCYKIIKGVSQGLNYLHNAHEESIYHLDLKPANVLLDNNMIPKIGDFGISRIFSSTKTITTATRMMGTMGFMPPEYINKQEISPKYDVFSLGAVIIQIMAGRQRYRDCGRFPNEKIIELVCEKWRKLHPTMSTHTWLEVQTCIEIALRCLEDDKDKRLTIKEIVGELNRIGIETLSLSNEATNLQSKEALAYNHYNNSASIGVRENNNWFKAPAEPMDCEHESIMRNPKIHAIGGREDVIRADNSRHGFRNQDSREKGSAHTLGIRDIMVGIAGVPSGISEFVNVFQWARSAISSEWGDTQEERFQDDICQLQSGLEFLRDTLPAMHDLIDRAEWRSHKDCVANLLPYLKDAVYDAEDLLDDLKWYNHKVIVEGNESKLSVTEFLRNLSKVNDINKRLVHISEYLEKMVLGEVTPRFDKTVRPETTSFCNETKIFGRDVLLKKMMRLLNVPTNSSAGSKCKWKPSADGASTSHQVSNESRLPDLPVLPLVGIGGVGKTTLAQHICSHPLVKSHFKIMIWICVSDDFDVKRLTKEAIESCTGKKTKIDNLNSLQIVLSRALSNERFLIVLDDMWDDALKEDGLCWKKFCAPFKNVLQGSMMLVTTRSQKVAKLVHTMEPIILEGLKDDVFWTFFKLCVFGSESSNDFPDLEDIGREILPKLKGSPLAAKTLGRMLQSDLHTSHWKRILDSELWALDQEATDIVPALRLSYMYLPFHLKRCFSFCAVYPKDKEFEKDSLAEIWVAEGFVKSRGVIPVQDTGCQYFNDLLNRSFFQKVQGKYVIHDLLHDMAQKVSEDDCYIVKKKDDFRRIPPNVRHLSVLSSNDIDNSDLSILCRYKKLRTLLCDKPLGNKKTPAAFLEDWCTELLRMRVIVFATLNELPASIGKLKHLQYLKISRACSVTSLPGTICKLHNLQVLCVRKCKLEILPSDFGMLVNLWRFESQGFQYGPNMWLRKNTIPNFQKECYYGLSLDAANDEEGLGFRLIKNMKQFHGHLVISNIHKLSKNHLAEAELWNKAYLDKLTLEWGNLTEANKEYLARQSGDNENGREVLRHLQPPAGAKSLVLDHYRGVSLPSWFEPQSLSALTSASFLCCRGLEIPTVPININSRSMGFSSLTELIIRRCDSLSSLDQLLDPTYLPVIKKIAIMYCQNLISVPTEKFEEFRCIELFEVEGCGKINSQSLAARSLKKFKLGGSKGMYWDNDCGNLSAANIQCCSLTYFSLSCRRLTFIQLQMWNLPALQELRISYCSSLTSIGQPGQVFINLTSLTISNCRKLSTIDGLLEEEYLPAIESITIGNCLELSTMTMHGRRFGGFSSLKNLKVSQCAKLDLGGFVLPSSLQSLHLQRCGDISSFIPSGLENLQSLVSLRLLDCWYRISIPGHLWSTTLSSLEELELRNCPELVSVGGADDISEIQNVWIKSCTKLKGIKQPLKRGSFL